MSKNTIVKNKSSKNKPMKKKNVHTPKKNIKDVDFLNFSDEEEVDNDLLEDIEDESEANEGKYKFDDDETEEENDSDEESEENEMDDKEEEINFSDDDDKKTVDNEEHDRLKSRELAKDIALKNKRTVFVGNISTRTTKKVLLQLFQSNKYAGMGSVESIRFRGGVAPNGSMLSQVKKRSMLTKNLSENSPFCAFVVLKKEEDLEKCLKLNRHTVDGRVIRVDVIKGKKPTYNAKQCVFLGNLPHECNETRVREKFDMCGNIVNVRLVRDKASGLCKGFGYLEFDSAEGVSDALKMSNITTLDDRLIRVQKWCATESQKEKRKRGEKKGQKPIEQEGKRKKFKVVTPSNMNNLELKEYIQSKHKKIIKKVQKKKSFVDKVKKTKQIK